MANRKQPFGYKIEQGQIAIDESEAEIVLRIFAQYNDGASLKEIAQSLNEQAIVYEADKLWNKNMVSRILADERYVGAKGYLPIIENDTFRCAAEKRIKKQPAIQQTETKKVLRRLHGQAVNAQIEQRVREIFVGLSQGNIQIENCISAIPYPSKVIQLESALEDEMDKQTIDEDTAKSLILQIAAAQYEAIRSEEYETQRLKNIFAECKSTQEPTAELLQSIIKKIHTNRGKIEVELKNGQIIQ